ncbi:hypothetical protein ElyMa_000184600 [Elysia marginata]|uniref:Mutator-like transposase domain-containing protein n=1 Tax=Elysia marginata TaxID=1093978 RepID=A0AAV4EWK3_9GAST|nr:hypothetical protein ElyMa_000184600 [Elysia marginata]
MTSKTLKGSNSYDINMRAVLSFLNGGLGFAGHTTFCETMGLEGLTEKTHACHVRQIHEACQRLKRTVLDKAVQEVKAAHGKAGDDIVDIAVSYDGTWQKRGHTSNHGLGVVIEVTTGLAVDYHVMSSFCQVSVK